MMLEKRHESPLLIFDLDNTLINRDRALQSFLKDFLHTHRDSFDAAHSGRIARLFTEMDQRGMCDRKLFIEKTLKMIPELHMSPGRLWAEFRKLPDYVEPDDQTILMLKRLSLRHEMTVVSNGSGNIQRLKMAKAGIDHFFKTCFISGENGCAKPNRNLFLKALDEFGYEPIQTVMIGDDPLKDIRAAKMIGMKTVFVAGDKNIENTYADRVITDILQLEEALPCLI